MGRFILPLREQGLNIQAYLVGDTLQIGTWIIFMVGWFQQATEVSVTRVSEIPSHRVSENSISSHVNQPK